MKIKLEKSDYRFVEWSATILGAFSVVWGIGTLLVGKLEMDQRLWYSVSMWFLGCYLLAVSMGRRITRISRGE